jgi:hypothetical protein
MFPSLHSPEQTRHEVQGSVDRKEFVVHVFPSPTYPHSANIKKSPLYGQWPKAPGKETFMSETLKRALPDNVAADGLSDWESAGQLLNPLENGMEDTTRLGAKAAFLARQMRRRQDVSTNAVMRGLAQFHDAKSRRSDSTHLPEEGEEHDRT